MSLRKRSLSVDSRASSKLFDKPPAQSFTLRFKDVELEAEYKAYRSRRGLVTLRILVLVLLGLMTASYATIGVRSRPFSLLRLLLVLATGLPMLLLMLLTFTVSEARLMSKVDEITCFLVFLIGNANLVARTWLLNTSDIRQSGSPSLFFCILLICAHHCLHVRFPYVAFSAVVNTSMFSFITFLSQITYSAGEISFMVLVSSFLSLFIAYEHEKTLRFKFLSVRHQRRQKRESHKPIVQIIETTENTPVQRAVLILKEMLAGDRGDEQDKVSMVYSLLLSTICTTPDAERQFVFTETPVDAEQEQWAMNEVGKRLQPLSKRGMTRNASDLPPASLRSFRPDSHKAVSRMLFCPGESDGQIVVATTQAPDEQTKKIIEYLVANQQNWTFDTFALADMSQGHSLLLLAEHLISRSGLLETLKLSPEKFMAFVSKIEKLYHADLPYHNSQHAADVLHSCWFLLQLPAVLDHVSDLDLLAVLFAAIIHDVDHPGYTNNFLITTGYRQYSLLYNDRSVLENHHAYLGFNTLATSEFNFTENLTKADFKTFRDTAIDLVLATDLSNHFAIISTFKNKISNGFLPSENVDEKILLFKMIMKCADVSNPAKDFDYYNRWVLLVLEEFHRQGDKEKELGIPVSPFSDRNNTNQPSSQIGFINFICMPLYETLNLYQPVPEMLEKLQISRSIWMSKLDRAQQQSFKSSGDTVNESPRSTRVGKISKISIRETPMLTVSSVIHSNHEISVARLSAKVLAAAAKSETNIHKTSGLRYETSSSAEEDTEVLRKSNSDGDLASKTHDDFD